MVFGERAWMGRRDPDFQFAALEFATFGLEIVRVQMTAFRMSTRRWMKSNAWREDDPHPVAAFPTASEFGHHLGVYWRLSIDETVQFKCIGHCLPPG